MNRKELLCCLVAIGTGGLAARHAEKTGNSTTILFYAYWMCVAVSISFFLIDVCKGPVSTQMRISARISNWLSVGLAALFHLSLLYRSLHLAIVASLVAMLAAFTTFLFIGYQIVEVASRQGTVSWIEIVVEITAFFVASAIVVLVGQPSFLF